MRKPNLIPSVIGVFGFGMCWFHALCGCAPSQSSVIQPPQPDRPHVILVSLDTLRRDAVGAFGGVDDVATAELDRFAEASVVFEDCFAQIPFTLPSHMSMFTGLYPDVHGVSTRESRLAAEVQTLPEILKAHGYQTFGVAAGIWMKSDFGFGRGFDVYRLMPFGLTFSSRIKETVRDQVPDLLMRPDPIFLFLHFFDPHSDFHDREGNTLPYFATEDARADVGIDSVSSDFCTPSGACATDFLLAANDDPSLVSPQVVDAIERLYHVGNRSLDRDLGEIFEFFRRVRIWDEALIVVTSDHGEPFMEHGEFIHNQPWVEDLAVPMMIKFPKGRHAGRRCSAPVETIDVLPTILQAIGADVPMVVQGRSLMSVVEGRASGDRQVLGRHKKVASLFALRSRHATLIFDVTTRESQYFDRMKDPEERHDISASYPEEVRTMEAALRRMVRQNVAMNRRLVPIRQRGSSLVTDDEADRLRAIGYVD
jgi:arylsulfatase A-like enzyme